ncbi:hypothetical protein H4R99_001455 [Coemansia sp. RSA 1722]|nr:hypothetical protein LPJ57_003106 [Coemansia sp. RSA 486]KAJ2235200.1 hypothetical protein IWW45_002794 [Coemansia sp. RSA 485]KAJ2604982.1 hypothetical protein H4R99_001455 [Coemansia sp. RSA 1722]KAJ2634620.1 hypothetical protein GGF40_004088 [Coemansia sp. RSA 1286]
MNNRPASTGFAALDGLLKRAREQKKANPAPSKRAAIDDVSGTRKNNSNNVPRPSTVAAPQTNEDTSMDDLDNGDALLDYVPDDIDDLLDGLPLEEQTTALPPPKPAQNPSFQRQPVNAVGSTVLPTAQSQVSRQVTASARLAQFEFRTPVAPPVASQRAVNTARSISFLQRHGSEKSAASSSISRSSASSRAFKTIERTIVESSKQKSAVSADGRQELPGPAGLINSTTEDVSETIAPTQRPVSVFRTPFARQPGKESASEADFESGTWSAMLDYLQLPSYTPRTSKRIMRDHKDTIGVTVHWVQKNVKQTQKVCRMLVQIQDIVGGDHDVNAVVVDPTGEMAASIHRQVVVDLARECTAGTSVILESVVVLVLAGAKPSLVVTSASIVRVFAVETSGSALNPIVLTQTQTQRPAGQNGLDRNASQGTPTRAPGGRSLRTGGDAESLLVTSSQVHQPTQSQSPGAVTSQAGGNGNNDGIDVLDGLGDVFMEGSDNVDDLLDMLDPSL